MEEVFGAIVDVVFDLLLAVVAPLPTFFDAGSFCVEGEVGVGVRDLPGVGLDEVAVADCGHVAEFVPECAGDSEVGGLGVCVADGCRVRQDAVVASEASAFEFGQHVYSVGEEFQEEGAMVYAGGDVIGFWVFSYAGQSCEGSGGVVEAVADSGGLDAEMLKEDFIPA